MTKTRTKPQFTAVIPQLANRMFPDNAQMETNAIRIMYCCWGMEEHDDNDEKIVAIHALLEYSLQVITAGSALLWLSDRILELPLKKSPRLEHAFVWSQALALFCDPSSTENRDAFLDQFGADRNL